MSEHDLTIAAVVFELGTAAAVLCSMWFGAPIRRHKGVVIAGAITPAIVFMADIAYAQMTQPAPGNMASAGWLMGFVAYALLLLGGAAVSWVPRPANPYARYLLGLATAAVMLGLLAIG